jgi:hypothetical protein
MLNPVIVFVKNYVRATIVSQETMKAKDKVKLEIVTFLCVNAIVGIGRANAT